MKFFENQNRLGVIGVEPDSVSSAVIGNAADVLHLMLLKNTPGLAGTGGTEQMVNFQFPKLFGKRFAFQIIPQLMIDGYKNSGKELFTPCRRFAGSLWPLTRSGCCDYSSMQR